MTEPVVLAVDVGGTSFKAAFIDAAGRTLLSDTAPTFAELGETVFARLDVFIGHVLETGAAQGLVPQAMGLITPGMDETTGRVMFSSNLGWRDFPLRERLAVHFDLPIAVGHDVRTAGLAEAQLGAARGAADFGDDHDRHRDCRRAGLRRPADCRRPSDGL